MVRKDKADRRSPAWPILALAICVFAWASLLTFDAGDWPSPNRYPHNDPAFNACGWVGAFVAYHLRRFIGDGVFILGLFATSAAVLWLIRGRIANLPQRIFGLSLLVLCTSASVHLLASPGPNSLPFGDGGLLGAALGGFLRVTFSGVGTALVLGYCFIVALLFTAEGWMLRLPGVVKRAAKASLQRIVLVRSAFARPATATAIAPSGEASITLPTTAGRRSTEQSAIDEPARREKPTLRINRGEDVIAKRARGSKKQPTLFDDVQPEDQPSRSQEAASHQTDPQTKQTRDRQEKATPQTTPSSAAALDEELAPPPEPYPKVLESWDYPSLSALDDPEYAFSAAQETTLRAQAKTLERTLGEFRLEAHVVEIHTGPVITMFEIELGVGIKVSQVSGLSNDIARALKALAVRVVAPIPGRTTVGIEVPNVNREKVRLKGLILGATERAKSMEIPLFLGKDARGNVLLADLAAMPHMLVAGTTGSGKSVCLNAIIMSFLMCRRPDQVKLILIDPKMVELSQFKDIPHLMCPIVTDMNRAERILDWAVTTMDERYALIAEARVRNVAAYNKLGPEEIYRRLQPSNEQERKQIPICVPHIVIIIDELADLMMTGAKEVEHHLSRLAQKSRAVGVHIIVATQRPEAKVVTGLIKSNLPCRIAFRVASRIDSRIVLDQNGAEVLMGQGDMLFLPAGSHKLIRAQGTYIEDHELHNVIKLLGDRGEPEFHPQLVRMRSTRPDENAERDPLLNK
ncbi:MAG: DNA translocase FtsK, partial [Planctomycetes bacterium]|nr:DNA translocase FtsK [Planctomycetota bacterium]